MCLHLQRCFLLYSHVHYQQFYVCLLAKQCSKQCIWVGNFPGTEHHASKLSIKWSLEPDFHDFDVQQHTLKMNISERKVIVYLRKDLDLSVMMLTLLKPGRPVILIHLFFIYSVRQVQLSTLSLYWLNRRNSLQLFLVYCYLLKTHRHVPEGVLIALLGNSFQFREQTKAAAQGSSSQPWYLNTWKMCLIQTEEQDKHAVQ